MESEGFAFASDLPHPPSPPPPSPDKEEEEEHGRHHHHHRHQDTKKQKKKKSKKRPEHRCYYRRGMYVELGLVGLMYACVIFLALRAATLVAQDRTLSFPEALRESLLGKKTATIYHSGIAMKETKTSDAIPIEQATAQTMKELAFLQAAFREHAPNHPCVCMHHLRIPGAIVYSVCSVARDKNRVVTLFNPSIEAEALGKNTVAIEVKWFDTYYQTNMHGLFEGQQALCLKEAVEFFEKNLVATVE